MTTELLIFTLTPWEFFQRYVAEAIGVIALVGMALFAFDYARHAKWKKHAQGRAVMYLIVTLGGTVLLLVTNGFLPRYPLRWAVEVLFYTPLAVAAFYLRYTLRQTLGLNSRWLVRIPKKETSEEDELDEDTQPRP